MAEVLKTKNNMKKNSALRKMPEIVKGGGGYTYKYTSSEEQSRIPGMDGLSDLMVRKPILEVKGPNSKSFKKISIDSDAGKAIMKEIGPKLKNVYKDKVLPIMKDLDPSELVPAVRMKRRSDGSMAKLKNESFMKRMKRLNKASSPVMKNGGGYGPGGLFPFPGIISDDLAEKIKIKTGVGNIKKGAGQILLEKIDKETRYKKPKSRSSREQEVLEKIKKGAGGAIRGASGLIKGAASALSELFGK